MLTRDDTLTIETWISTAVTESEDRVAQAIGQALREHTDRPPSERGIPSLKFGRVDAVYEDYADVIFDGETAPTPVMLLGSATIGDRAGVLFSPPSGALLISAVTGAGSTATNFWSYSAGTLQPDPTTTTPLSGFEVATSDTDGNSLLQLGTAGVGNFILQASDTLSVKTASIFTGGNGSVVVRSTDDSDPSIVSTLQVGSPGSFSLTADDGTNQFSVLTSAAVVEMRTTDGTATAFVNADNAAGAAMSYDDGTHDIAITIDTGGTGSVGRVTMTSDGANTFSWDKTDFTVDVTDDIDLIAGDRLDLTATTVIGHTGHIGTNQTASATIAVGTLAAKLPIYDNANTLIGYVPLYASIT